MQNSKNLPYMHGFACIVGIFTYRKRKVLWEKKHDRDFVMNWQKEHRRKFNKFICRVVRGYRNNAVMHWDPGEMAKVFQVCPRPHIHTPYRNCSRSSENTERSEQKKIIPRQGRTEKHNKTEAKYVTYLWLSGWSSLTGKSAALLSNDLQVSLVSWSATGKQPAGKCRNQEELLTHTHTQQGQKNETKTRDTRREDSHCC